MTLFPPKKYTPFVSLSVLLIIISCIVWFGILPFKQSIEKKMRDIQEFYAGRENRERQIGKLPELQGQYDSIMENEKMLNILITEHEVVNFVKILEKLANVMNVKMDITSKDNGKIIEAEETENEISQLSDTDGQSGIGVDDASLKTQSFLDVAPFYRYLFLNVKVEGRYEDIMAFLGRMETLPFGLDVIKVDMEKKDAENNSQTASRGDLMNPFGMLGDASDFSQKQQPVENENKDAVEAVFDVLVYVKKD